MSENVWATPKASKRSKGQAQRRNPSTFTMELEFQKMRVEDQGKNEKTRGQALERMKPQPSSGALVPWSPPSVPWLVATEYQVLPTQPGPATEFYTDQVGDQSPRRTRTLSDVNMEEVLSKLNRNTIRNEYLGRLYPTRSEKGETVIEICSNLIRLQEGFSAIGGLAQHEQKCSALIIAFGLLTRQVGNQSRTRSLAFARASEYIMQVIGQESRFPLRPWRTMVRNNECSRVTGKDDEFANSIFQLLLGDLGKSRSYAYMIRTGEEKLWKSRALTQFGEKFWRLVGSLALWIPEVDDIATQVGLMCTVLLDSLVLCSHRMSDAEFHHWSQDIGLRSVISATAAREFSLLDEFWQQLLHK